jgi:hypothetical protein
MSVKVLLSNVGNPDRRQDSDRPLPGTRSGYWVEVADIEEASRACRDYIAANDLGGGNWPHAEVRVLETDEVLGHISYNGRFWEKEPSAPAPGM